MDPLRLVALHNAFALQAYDMLLIIACDVRHNLVNFCGFVQVLKF